MSNRERTVNFLVSTAFPNAYFLDEGLWRVSAEYSHLNSLPRYAGVMNETRVHRRAFDAITRSWNRHNKNLDRQDPCPIVGNSRFELLDYRRALVFPGYDVFLCPRCESLFTRDQVAGNNFCCLEHDVNVSQLAHLFVHSACGTVTQVGPKKCWNRFNDRQCNTPLRLHLEYQQMGASYWWCPTCRFKRRLPEQRGDDQPGWKVSRLVQPCVQCSTSQQREWMTLTPARTVFRPQRIDLVDVPQANYQNLLQDWFGAKVDDDVILEQLPPFLRQRFLSDVQLKEQIRRQYQAQEVSDLGVPDPEPLVKEELSDYAGAKSAVIRRTEVLPADVQNFMADNFGLRVSLLDNLAIVRATYGYLVGASSPDEALLRVFPMGGPRYAVLTQRNPTEALLFELEPQRILDWLHQKKLATPFEDEISLRRHLVSCSDDDAILNEVTGLVHTASHALRRSSERYTGMGRDVVDELLFTRGLAWVLYNNRGSELGMFTTTFDGRMREWLMGTQYDMLNCPLDPICMDEDVAACPGCLHIGERGCTSLWNRFLDRRYLVSLPTSTAAGYWS